jgi:hypothetical protein
MSNSFETFPIYSNCNCRGVSVFQNVDSAYARWVVLIARRVPSSESSLSGAVIFCRVLIVRVSGGNGGTTAMFASGGCLANRGIGQQKHGKQNARMSIANVCALISTLSLVTLFDRAVLLPTLANVIQKVCSVDTKVTNQVPFQMPGERGGWMARWLTTRLHPVSKFLPTCKGPKGTSIFGQTFRKKADSWNPREGPIPAWNPISLQKIKTCNLAFQSPLQHPRMVSYLVPRQSPIERFLFV